MRNLFLIRLFSLRMLRLLFFMLFAAWLLDQLRRNELERAARHLSQPTATNEPNQMAVEPREMLSTAASELDRTPLLVPIPDVDANDDLTELLGIGPKIAEALNTAGINTFTRLVQHQADQLEKIVRDAGVRMVGHAHNWVKEATLVLEGKVEARQQFREEIRHSHSSSDL